MACVCRTRSHEPNGCPENCASCPELVGRYGCLDPLRLWTAPQKSDSGNFDSLQGRNKLQIGQKHVKYSQEFPETALRRLALAPNGSQLCRGLGISRQLLHPKSCQSPLPRFSHISFTPLRKDLPRDCRLFPSSHYTGFCRGNHNHRSLPALGPAPPLVSLKSD